ncbi:MAG: helix-turn-helix transcriptional regulator [Clostridia bacterium]|nr:helix-turn-helix transcriptional regulator [Clostridia bacterium]
MFFENELSLLRDVLNKCQIRAVCVSIEDDIDMLFDMRTYSVLGITPTPHRRARDFLEPMEDCTVYKFRDRMGLQYLYIPFSGASSNNVLFIGPYLSRAFSAQQIIEMCDEHHLSAPLNHHITEWLSHLPVIPDGSPLFVMIYSFCERIWMTPSFSIVDKNAASTTPPSPINSPLHRDNFEDLLLGMRLMEKRYEFENEMIQAITLGQVHNESRLFAAVSDDLFERRVADPTRNAKNYCIIMNTLSRKAAEMGGVHPVYIDKVSSDFAYRIERCVTQAAVLELMREMFRSYCKLVRKHSTKNYSQIVQKTMLIIDSDLAADLTLSSLASNQGVSAGYLSTVFKRETNRTVSQYIRERRIKHAIHLLTATRLQIQTVALQCGIVDVQYFSKIFKKETGKTPKEYRESMS